MAIVKKIKPPKISPPKKTKKLSNSPIGECSLERPILLKKAEKVIMIVTNIQPLSLILYGKILLMLKKSIYPIKHADMLTSGAKRSKPISAPWTEIYHIA